ncbi:DmsC/YnfH family molybdoenzyme membrane anchor subunit [Phycisphaerales bacterium AB-hyl4]|uniref:DmsC/YnfH family molybdoenzyme membrane anchor subunit n=1 Tax=Natronomicrosphaera hydrolytica TaxID=3242702 RepID=A0ABV4U7J9_9BACT
MTTVAPTSLTVEGRELVQDFLTEQRRMTAVDRFSQRYDHDDADGGAPAQARYYRDLIPLAKPEAGQQYAFEVDLDACSGCKACVSACHNLNGLDEGETWREVGQLVSGPLDDLLPGALADEHGASSKLETGNSKLETTILQHITTACHHCLEPGCLEGCPVKAYDKDPVTGIVKHLDDQCIGCQYCVFKCPYDVPKYHKGKGIVRKCDMCSDRLAEGEAPACAQACPTQAIRIRIVDVDEVRADATAGRFLPASPSPADTKPTTRYRTRRDLAGARAADAHRLEAEHAHLPLVIMLVLTQLAVGGYLIGAIIEWLTAGALFEPVRSLHATLTLVFAVVALGASTLHLGRPMYAFRAVLGLRTSWLSREIVSFGGFAKLAFAYAGVSWFAADMFDGVLVRGLAVMVAVSGLAGVFCSVMIYVDTPRPFWRASDTGPKYLLTMLILGAAVTLLSGGAVAAGSSTVTFYELMAGWGRPLCLLLAGLTLLKLAWEARVLLALRDIEQTPMKRSARLLVGPLARVTFTRTLTGLAGGVALPLLLVQSTSDPAAPPPAFLTIIGIAFVLLLVGELLERYLFFSAVSALKMPGGLHA